MTNTLDKNEKGSSKGDRKRGLQYTKEFVPIMLLYTAAILTSSKIGDDTQPKKWIGTILPMIPITLVAWVVARHVKRLDEYARLQVYKSLAVSFGVTMVTTLFCSFLAFNKLVVDEPMLVMAPFLVGMTFWGLLAIVLLRK
jgi:hypothetical protein